MKDFEKIIHKDNFDGNIVYGGNEFNETTNRKDIIDDQINGVWGKEFFNGSSSTYSLKTEKFEKIEYCLCCKSKNISHKLTLNALSIFQCNDCTFGFQNPRIKYENVHEIYNNTYIMDVVYDNEIAQKLDKVKFEYGVQTASRYINSIQSIMDVGCGTGLSLDVYEKMGIPNVYGIDPGKYSTKKDLRITSSFMTEIPEQYKDLSLITFWDTLEHIHDFKYILSSAHKALKVNGLCLIMVPNFLSLATRLMRERSPTFQIDHLQYFTQNSLKLILKESGFDVMHEETVISEIDNCRNYLEFKEPYFSIPMNEQAFDWLTADYIHKNMLGSRLLFIGKKK